MSRVLFVLSEAAGFLGAVVLILSVVISRANYLNAGLISLLISAVLMIGAVVVGRMESSNWNAKE